MLRANALLARSGLGGGEGLDVTYTCTVPEFMESFDSILMLQFICMGVATHMSTYETWISWR